MKYLAVSFVVALSVSSAQSYGQESAAGGQAAPPTTAPAPATPTPSNQPSGLLTPPPDAGATTPPPDAGATATPPSAGTTTSPSDAGATPGAMATPLAPDASAAPAPTAPTMPAAPLSPREIRSVQRDEIIRRQELIYRADESLKNGRKAEVAAQYPEARKDYLFSAEAYSTVSRSTNLYATAAEGLTRVDLELYEDALKIGDTARAKRLIDEVVKYNPNNKLANEKEVAINRMIANPNDTSQFGNPALTPGLVNHLNEVQQLFAEAEQFRRTGQWSDAEARLKRILGIDPYNIAATKQLERIDEDKLQYDEHARLETRDERLRQVEEKWYEPITNKDVTTGPQEGQPTIIRSTNFGIDEKMKDIFLSLDFNNATIEEATNFLSVESKRLDPEHKGVNFVIQPEASSSAKPVSITLNNVPLGEALRYVCQLANVKFKVQDYAISIVPFSQNTDDLISRTFIVQPNFVAAPSSTGVIGSATAGLLGGTGDSSRPLPASPEAAAPEAANGDTVRQALIAKGVKFPPGASAVYTQATGQLTVVDTADQMELLEELVNAGQAPTLMVQVRTKFVEINQDDLNDLTFNTAFNFFTPSGAVSAGGLSTSLVGGTSFSTALPGALGLAPDSIDELITPNSTATNAFFFHGVIDNAAYNLVITALAQKRSFDLLSDPTVLTKSGEQGILEAVRVFPYPISFDPPQLVTQTQTNTINLNEAINPPTIIPTTPTDFKRRNVGVRLVVKPQVTSDNRTIDLSLFPEVTDFDGFINYGSAIFVANPDGTQSLLTNNIINQPVFNTRRINTKVLIRDGSTVVLGGLIRDDVQTVNDRVPILGDIPLVGRLFQSKSVANNKRNLIMFVTANIYRNDGELLNPPESSDVTDVLTGQVGFVPATKP